MTHNSLIGSFESLWHYGLPSTSTPLHSISSIATPPSNPTHPSYCLVLSPLANKSSVSSPVGSLQSLFSVIDEDGDGRLSLCEMRSLLAKLSMSCQSADLESFIKQTSSTDDDLSLDFPQFTQLYASLFSASHICSTEADAVQNVNDDCFGDELLDAFRVYDANHDGFISAAELASVLLELGLLADRSGIDANLGRCQTYIDSVDLDGNGMVDLGEFKSMMTQHHLSTSGFLLPV